MVHDRREIARIQSDYVGETLIAYADGLYELWRAGEPWPISTFGVVGWLVTNDCVDDPEFDRLDPVVRAKVRAAAGR